MAQSEDNKDIRGYLLGTLSEEGQQLMDERLLNESEMLDELLVCEEELIDDYVNDDLPADSRLRFEQHFLCSPERQQKLTFAYALGRYTSPVPEPAIAEQQKDQPAVLPKSLTWSERFKVYWAGQSLAFRYAAAVAVFAFVVAFVWTIRPFVFAPRTFATVTLSLSSGDRAEGTATSKVKLDQNVDGLKILLQLPDMPATPRVYRVAMIDSQGGVKPVEVLERNGQALVVVIPAKQLARGDYALRLYVTNPNSIEQRVNGSYFFTVE